MFLAYETRASTVFLIVYRQLVTGNWVESEGEKNKVEDSEMEESCHLKGFDYLGEINPIFQIKVTNFNYEYPPTTTFYNLYVHTLITSHKMACLREMF